ncbi:MAG: O-antigen ligase family protein [Candidatus Paceibacterota bacterium]
MGKRSREKQENKGEEQYRTKEKYVRRSSLEKIYLLIIEWGTYLALLTPFILIKSYFFPYVSPKTVFFRIIVDIIFIAYILLLVSNPKYRPRNNALTVSIVVFLGIIILSSIIGVNFEKSFWSVFERMTGVLTFLHLFGFYIVLTSVFKEKKYWDRILTVAILIGVLICIYTFSATDPSTKGGGTLGNTSFLAACLLFYIFFAAILFFTKSGWWKVFYGSCLLVLLSGLLISREPCRGAIGAFLISALFLGLSCILFSGYKKIKRFFPLALILVVLVAVGVLQTGFAKGIIAQFNNFSDDSRNVVWRMSFEAWKEKPWLGWGQENFNIPFAKYFSPNLPLSGDLWYDRAHSIIFDTLVASGILGLLSYLSIFVIAAIGMFRLLPKIVERKNIFIPLGMIAILLSYFLQNFWVFDMISSYMLLFLSLAFICFLINSQKPVEEQADTKRGALNPFFASLLIIATVSAFYFGNVKVAEASRLTVMGIATKDLEKSISYFQEALATSPISIYEVPEQFSQKIVGSIYDTQQKKDVLLSGFSLAEEAMKKNMAKNPMDFRVKLLLGRHYNSFFQVSADATKLELAEKVLQEAMNLSPKNQQVYWGLAQTYFFEGKSDEAIGLLKKAVDLEPRYIPSHWYLFMGYKISEKYDLALEELKNIEKTGYDWKANLEDLKRVISVYESIGDNKSLAELYPLAIEKSPKDAQLFGAYATVQANLGQYQSARDLAAKALELDPSLKQKIEQFLNSLPQ